MSKSHKEEIQERIAAIDEQFREDLARHIKCIETNKHLGFNVVEQMMSFAMHHARQNVTRDQYVGRLQEIDRQEKLSAGSAS